MRALSPVLALVIAIVLGAAMDATIKHLGNSNHILLVALGRYAFGAAFSMIAYAHAGMPRITPPMWRVHGLRGLVTTFAGTGFFWSITVLPLAEAVTYSFVGVLLIPFAARVIAGETLRPSSLAAGVIGFVGVGIAASGAPNASESPLHAWGVVAVLVSAALFAVSMALLRLRAAIDGAPAVSLLSSLVPALILVVPTSVFATPPNLSDWPVFLLMGLFAAAFMYMMARAYAHAEAQQLAPIHYSELLWASVIGYFIFSELPRPQIYLGAVLIVAAGLLAAWDERRLTRARS
ncbi:MAG: DMT family transporter [Hyphomonadaceae bacterium]|nr:DMT family transporter [Hyphomonadaceae bacterium]